MTATLKTLTPALCCAGGIIAGTAVATFTMDHSLPVRMLGPLVFAASMLGADMLIARARGAAPRPSGTAIFLALSCLVALSITALGDPDMVAIMLPVLGGGIAASLFTSDNQPADMCKEDRP